MEVLVLIIVLHLGLKYVRTGASQNASFRAWKAALYLWLKSQVALVWRSAIRGLMIEEKLLIKWW